MTLVERSSYFAAATMYRVSQSGVRSVSVVHISEAQGVRFSEVSNVLVLCLVSIHSGDFGGSVMRGYTYILEHF